MKVNDVNYHLSIAEDLQREEMMASRDKDIYEAGPGGATSPFNRKGTKVHDRQAAATNPLLGLGGGKDPIELGKAAVAGDNSNTKPTNASDMYECDKSLLIVRKNLDEFPTYTKDPQTGDMYFRK